MARKYSVIYQVHSSDLFPGYVWGTAIQVSVDETSGATVPGDAICTYVKGDTPRCALDRLYELACGRWGNG